MTVIASTDLYSTFESAPAYPAAPPTSVCAKLKEKSLATLSGAKRGDQKITLNPEALTTEDMDEAKAPAISQVFNACILCHTIKGSSDTDFPQFPFNNEALLKAKLNEGGYPRGTFKQEILFRIDTKGDDQMPPSGSLSAAEISAIKTYIGQLDR
jgi:mono/diheme cytochrome c family protein